MSRPSTEASHITLMWGQTGVPPVPEETVSHQEALRGRTASLRDFCRIIGPASQPGVKSTATDQVGVWEGSSGSLGTREAILGRGTAELGDAHLLGPVSWPS